MGYAADLGSRRHRECVSWSVGDLQLGKDTHFTLIHDKETLDIGHLTLERFSSI